MYSFLIVASSVECVAVKEKKKREEERKIEVLREDALSWFEKQ